MQKYWKNCQNLSLGVLDLANIFQTSGWVMDLPSDGWRYIIEKRDVPTVPASISSSIFYVRSLSECQSTIRQIKSWILWFNDFQLLSCHKEINYFWDFVLNEGLRVMMSMELVRLRGRWGWWWGRRSCRGWWGGSLLAGWQRLGWLITKKCAATIHTQTCILGVGISLSYFSAGGHSYSEFVFRLTVKSFVNTVAEGGACDKW